MGEITPSSFSTAFCASSAYLYLTNAKPRESPVLPSPWNRRILQILMEKNPRDEDTTKRRNELRSKNVPSIPRDEDIHHLTVLVEEREEVVCRRPCEKHHPWRQRNYRERGVEQRVNGGRHSRNVMLRTRREYVSLMSGGPDRPKCDIARWDREGETVQGLGFERLGSDRCGKAVRVIYRSSGPGPKSWITPE